MIKDIGVFADSENKRSILPSRAKMYEYTFFLVVGFLLSRVNILATIDSFGYAWLIVLFITGHSTVWGALGAIAGRVTVLGLSVLSAATAFGEIGVYVGVYVLLLIVRSISKKPSAKLYAIIGVVFYAASEASLVVLSEMTIYSTIYVVMNIVSIVASIYVFMHVTMFSHNINFTDMTNSDTLLFVLTISLTVMGIGSISLWNIDIRMIIIYAIVLISSHLYGVGAGAFMGALFGVLVGLNANYSIMFVIPLTLCGLLGGMMKNANRIISSLVIVVFSGALFLLMEYNSDNIHLFIEATAGAFVCAVFPYNVLNSVKSSVLMINMPLTSTKTYAERVKLVCENKIDDVCSSAGRMHKTLHTYLEGTEKSNNEQLEVLMSEITDVVCTHCTLGDKCAFANNPNGKRNPNCRVAQIMNKINYLGNTWRGKMRMYRSIPEITMACFCDSVNAVKKSLENSIEVDIVLTEQAESECMRACKYVNSVAVLKADNGYEILVELKTLSVNDQYIDIIKSKCEDVINAALSIRDIMDGMIMFEEKAKYIISTGVTLISYDKDGVCGDTSTVVPFGNEGFMMAIADGCGTGYPALHESNVAMELMETMAECGSKEDSAVSLINTLMGLRMDGDRYSTADICVLNKYTGNAKFIKMGAVCSFILRGKDVIVVECGASPLGVQGEPYECVRNYKLRSGDVIIMMTDGVYDSCAGYKDPNVYFVDMLKGIKITTAQDMADKIMDKALENVKKPKDDMLVFVSILKSA